MSFGERHAPKAVWPEFQGNIARRLLGSSIFHEGRKALRDRYPEALLIDNRYQSIIGLPNILFASWARW